MTKVVSLVGCLPSMHNHALETISLSCDGGICVLWTHFKFVVIKVMEY